MRVIYIAGMSHSGSTLLNLMLNAHPQIASVGELIDLKRRTKQHEKRGRYTPCACGAPSLFECEFWSGVNARTVQLAGKTLAELDVLNDRSLDEGCASNALVLRAVAETSKKRFVVDSSKRPGRLAYLMQLKGLDVFPIHLVRDPHGQICSLRRKNGGFLKHVHAYVRIHSQISRIVKSVPHAVVQYHNLIREPEHTLKGVLGPLGLQFDPLQLQWAEQEQHTLGGNNLRWQPTGLVVDERWKHSLSRFQKLAIAIGTAYSQRRLRGST